MESCHCRCLVMHALVIGMPAMVDVEVVVVDALGLGIDLDPATLERYRAA